MHAWKDARPDSQASDNTEVVSHCPSCRVEWIEPEAEQELTCLALDADAFDIYTEWLYTTHISTSSLIDTKLRSTPHTNHKFMLSAYELGVFVSDQGFQKAVLHTWIEMMEDTKSYPSPSLTTRVYDMFPAGSPIRRLMVEIYASKADVGWYEREDRDKFCQEFFRDVLVRMLAMGVRPVKRGLRGFKKVCWDMEVQEVV
jgi:hypothetical protein